MYVAGRRRLAQPGGLTLRFAPRLVSHEVCTLNVLSFSRLRSEGWPHHGRTFSSTESPVHVLMLSIQAVRGLPRLRAPGIVSVH